MLWAKRRSSRSDLYNSKKTQPISSTPRRTPLFAASPNPPPSPRLPFAPLDPLDPLASQSSFTGAADNMPLSHDSSSSTHDAQAIKNSIARQIVNRNSTEKKDNQSLAPNQSRRPPPEDGRRDLAPSSPTAAATSTGIIANPYAPRADLYTYNSLNSFSFGSVQTQPPPSSSRTINLLAPHDDADNGSDDSILPLDVTPRPSVVGHRYPLPTPNHARSHPSQPPGPPAWPPSVTGASTEGNHAAGRDHDRIGRDWDTVSHHTLAVSSSSASVSSLSSTSNSRAGSRASRLTDTTTQTSANDLSSTDDEEDHHHPIPPQLASTIALVYSSTGSDSGATGTGSTTAVEFSSDEDYDGSEYDYDDYNDEDGRMNIEIGSAQYEGSVLSTDHWDRGFYAYGSGSSGSVKASSVMERRGSLPIAIPGAIPVSDSKTGSDAFFVMGRDREDSLATLRRPSRSLNDDLRILTPGPGLPHGSTSGNITMYGEGSSNRTLPPAPVSVPESDGDWRSLQERTKAKGKAKEVDGPASTFGTIAPPIHPPTGQSSASAMDGFDLDWSALRGGITTLDQSQVADIIRPIDVASTSDNRRPSAANLRWLTMSMLGNLGGGDNTRRPSTGTVVSVYGNDSFGKAVGKWGGDGYQAQRRDWSFRKEKMEGGGPGTTRAEARAGRGSITGFLNPRGSTGIVDRSGFPSGTTAVEGERDRDWDKLREKDDSKEADKDKSTKSPAAVWKGMLLDSQELWRNDLVGRFKVDRRASKPTDPAKGPQQRLIVQHFRDSHTLANIPHNGPPVTIHKHSKAIAFSISRHYRPRPLASTFSRDSTSISAGPRSSARDPRASTRALPSRDGGIVATTYGGSTVVPATKKNSSMILLAPRRVQEAFTSTNTTRKLESHGLLDDKDPESISGAKQKERLRRHEEKEREKEKRAEKVQRKKSEERKSKSKLKQNRSTDELKGQTSSGSGTAGTSSTFSAPTLVTKPLPAPPMAALTAHTYPPPESSATVGGTLVLETRSQLHTARQRRRIRDPLDVSDSEEDNENIAPTRTPHSEAYGTIDASVIDQLRPRQERSHISDFESNTGFLKRLIRGRGIHSAHGLASVQVEPFYEPPWLVLASRNKQELQQRVVENLNTSFKGVGLLPSTHKDKHRHASSSQKQKKIASGSSNSVDIFEEIPSDSLYMLLPLWPGDTDPVSERRVGSSFEKPYIPSDQRQYLLVYYNPTKAIGSEENGKHRGEGESKKRPRNLPTTSNDSAHKREGSSILLTSFHISARLVSYNDLQGSGVRVPDEGLTVTGPLDAAYATMPSAIRDEGLIDWVIGICHSREAGIEFYPEGLVKMGLCLLSSVPVRGPEAEEYVPPEPTIELTPIGRAVLEMAWLGCMALTSFRQSA